MQTNIEKRDEINFFQNLVKKHEFCFILESQIYEALKLCVGLDHLNWLGKLVCDFVLTNYKDLKFPKIFAEMYPLLSGEANVKTNI